MTSDVSSLPGSPLPLDRASAFDFMERERRSRLAMQWPLLLGLPVVAVVCALLFLSMQKPVYEARGLIELMPGITGSNLGSGTNKRAVGDEIVLLRTAEFQRRVLGELSPSDLAAVAASARITPDARKKIWAGGPNGRALSAIRGVTVSRHLANKTVTVYDDSLISDTLLLDVVAEDTNPQLAAALVNATVRAARGVNFRMAEQRSERLNRFVESKLTTLEARIQSEEAEDRRLDPDSAGTFALASMPASTIAPRSKVRSRRTKRAYQLQGQQVSGSSEQIEVVPPSSDPMLPVIEKAAERAQLEERLTKTRLKLQKTLGADLGDPADPRAGESLGRRLQNELDQARVEYQTMAATLGANHPSMERGLARIEALQQELRAFGQRSIRAAERGATETGVRAGVLSAGAVQERRDAIALLARQDKAAVLEVSLATDLNLLELMKERTQDTVVDAELSAPMVNVIDLAPLPVAPARQPTLRFSGFAAFGGLCLGFVIVLLWQLAGLKRWTADEVENAVKSPVLAAVRQFDDGPSAHGTAAIEDLDRLRRGFEEPLSGLRDALPWLGGQPGGQPRARRDSRMILVISANPGDGATSTASALATLLARLGDRVLLVETNMQHPSLRRRFQLSGSLGLSHVLAGVATLDQASQRVPIADDGAGSLDVLALGPAPPDPFQALRSDALSNLLGEARRRYRYVILDGSLAQGVNGMVTSDAIDTILLVTRYGSVDLRTLRIRRRLLDNARLPLTAVVINGVPC
jgi:Mrp family chromosome partitioning ATPase/uncharacterized protein involved in exopolysaccharide biosynthesis